jgi:spermidine synthase
MLSIGGALGGLLVGLAAPHLLPAYFELPITLMLCAVLLLLVIEYRKTWVLLAASWAAATAVILMSGYYMVAYRQSVSVMARNFYGGLRVNEYDRGTRDETRVLVHGTVTHGMQYTAPDRRNELISYYGPGSGIYLAAQYLRSEAAGSPLRVGIIGLGAGSLAAYASLGDVFRFYEINPLVVKLAWDEFTFLGDCRGKVDIILGDGRLSLERERDRHYDLLVVDAFSGDAIPVHLLTREAIKLYFRHLKTGGILALHITNTHLDLEPVVEKLRTALGKHAVLISTESNEKRNIYRSRWALLTSRSIASSAIRESSGKFSSRSDIQVWTDEYNNLFQILK